jgi:hypothetical protein
VSVFLVGQPVSKLLGAGAVNGSARGQCGANDAVLATRAEFADPATGRRLSVHIRAGRIGYVTIWTRAHRTSGGLGVGSGLAEVMRSSATAELYGDATAGSVIVKDPAGGALLFAMRGGATKALVAGPVGELRRIAEHASRDPRNMSLFC